jgi:hypothetical protein
MAHMTAAAPAHDPRIFEFRPSRRGLSRILSEDQRDAYDTLGFVDRVGVYTRHEIDLLRPRFDRLLQATAEDGGGGYSVQNMHTTCETLYDMLMEPRILDAVEDLIGPDIVCWSTHCFCKQPGDGKAVSWHQDAPYWGLTPTRTVTVWVAIDDVDAGNGALQLIPGSHRHGAIPMRQSAPEEDNVLWLTTEGWERYGAPVVNTLAAGEMSIHADLLVHGSERNRSTRRRCALAIRYCTPEVRQTGNHRTPSVICRGSDPGSYWRHFPRPDGDRAVPWRYTD